jgi:ABC-type branched-subunit amino acid transport system substrate-binding protein
LKAKATHADGYALVITSGQSVAAIKGRAAAGITDVTACDLSCVTPPLSPIFSRAALANVWTENNPINATPAAKRSASEQAFIAALKSEGHTVSLVVPSIEYDSMMVVAEAAKQAGSIDETAMKNALEHLHAPQSFGSGVRFQYSPTSHYPAPDGAKNVLTAFPAAWKYADDVFTP